MSALRRRLGATMTNGDDSFRCEVVIESRMGLHARPAARIVELAGKFDCAVRIIKDVAVVDGKSILQILSLAAATGTLLTIETHGHEGLAAITALAGLMMEINKEEAELA